MKKIASVFAIASIGGITALGLDHFFEKNPANNNSQISYQSPVKYVNMPSFKPEGAIDFTAAAESTVHAVVNVKTTYAYEANPHQYYDPFRDFFGQRTPRPQEAPMATGSGVIVSADGYIVT